MRGKADWSFSGWSVEGHVPLLLQSRTQISKDCGRRTEEMNTGTIMNMQIYAQESKAMSDRSEQPVGERNLWVAILLQALEDWHTGTLRRRQDAERFFFKCERDFAAVCRGAGLDPATVVGKLQGMKKNDHRTLEISWQRIA